MGDIVNKIKADQKHREEIELRKHLYRLKEQGADLVKVGENPFERYIDSVEVTDDDFKVTDPGIKKISVCNETNAPFEVIIEFCDGSRRVFVNHPVVINYRLREIKLPGKDSR